MELLANGEVDPGTSVLVVDDNEDDRHFLKQAFLRAGVHAPLEFVDGGKQAMDYLAGRGEFADRSRFPIPSLIILDAKMPGVDGFDVLGWLRKQPGFGVLPVIVFADSDWPGNVNRAYGLGANSYFVKPCDLAGFEQVARSIGDYWLGHRVRLPRV